MRPDCSLRSMHPGSFTLPIIHLEKLFEIGTVVIHIIGTMSTTLRIVYEQLIILGGICSMTATLHLKKK